MDAIHATHDPLEIIVTGGHFDPEQIITVTHTYHSFVTVTHTLRYLFHMVNVIAYS